MFGLSPVIRMIGTRCRLHQFRNNILVTRHSSSNSSNDAKDESLLLQDLDLPGVHLDEIDKIMSDEVLQPLDSYYPKLNVNLQLKKKPLEGHNVMVIQPWMTYANFADQTDPELQLEECVSLGNTIHNWNVIGKKIVFAKNIHRKHIVGPGAFEELRETIHSHEGVSAVFFGLQLLSAIQLATLERDLRLAVYDRFTVVLNIFRQHARTKEAKIQLALAELPYIETHLREIHESSEYSSLSESLKTLVGGTGERLYQRRVHMLKRRERKLKSLLDEFRKQRELNKKQRSRGDIPTVSIVGYTNCGKTSLIKYLTQDERLVPRDQLFATLDVSAHLGQLPSSSKVFYLDTVGFLSRIPTLLIEAFSATLRDVKDSDLIVHLLDLSHPDHKLQHITVIKALESLKVSKRLLKTRLTVGNKSDLIKPDVVDIESLPKCDLNISAKEGINMSDLVESIDRQLMANLRYEKRVIRVENGGKEYSWLLKYATVIDCEADESDPNYLVCRVNMSPAALGRWAKLFGSTDTIK